jgi:ubiquitin carboxyl-terminal hydrolase 5/13
VGCGRKIYGIQDSGCLNGKEGAAVRHFEQNQDTCTIAVKLGTLSSTSADVYCYVEDAMVNDPFLREHLKHFNIDLDNVSFAFFKETVLSFSN